MCCGDCSPIRCPAVPNTDWSAFTWRWQSPAAQPFGYTAGPSGSPIDFLRQITAQDRAMFYPGICNCLWMVALEDLHIELPLPGTTYYAPSFGVLQRVGQAWQLSIARWFWGLNSDYWTGGYYRDWSLEAVAAGECSNFRGGYGGWTPYGWNGFGWAYGWGYGWGLWSGNYTTIAIYTLAGKLLTDGSQNVFVQSSFDTTLAEESPANWNDGRYWPATVTLSRIAKNGAL